MSPRSADAASLALDRALADWVEAEAIVAALRRSARAATDRADRAAERAQTASILLRNPGNRAFAAGAFAAAQVLAHRASVEERRLEEAQRVEAILRGRFVAARAAVATAGAGERMASCG